MVTIAVSSNTRLVRHDVTKPLNDNLKDTRLNTKINTWNNV